MSAPPRQPDPEERRGGCTVALTPVADKVLIELVSESTDAAGVPLWQERLLMTAKDLAKLVGRGQQVLAALR